MNDFTPDSYALFEELAAEKYDFGACKSGEKMTFGKCQKVGGSSKNAEKSKRLNDMKATAERNLAVAKKNKNASSLIPRPPIVKGIAPIRITKGI